MYLRRKLRGNRKVIFLIFSGAVLFAWFQQNSYEPLSLSGIMEFTNLQEARKPKKVFIHPNWKCKEHLRKNTVIMVLSKASNRLQRETIRQTWGHPRNQMSFNFSLYFVVGNEQNVDFTEIQTENDDILHVDVDESYFKITGKVIEAMNWAILSCDSRYFWKIDDDVYFNVFFLQKLNRNGHYLTDGVILGDCLSETNPFRMTSKFIVSSEEYPFAKYPPYCGGPGYAMTLQTARKLYHEMTITKPFKFEDVYLGVVAYTLGILIKKVDRFVYAMDGYFFHDLNIACAKIIHNLTPEQMTQLWNKQRKQYGEKPDCTMSLWEKFYSMF